MNDNPQVQLDWSMWCHKHLHPLKDGWPHGAGLAMVGLFNAAMADDKITNACDGKAENIGKVLKRFSPLCCYLGDAIANDIIQNALDGKVYGRKDGTETAEGLQGED